MTDFIAGIEALPEEDQLPYAIEIIRTLTCLDTDRLAHFTDMGLTASEARIVNYLAVMRGKAVSEGQIREALYGTEFGPDSNIIAQFVFFARRKLPPSVKIEAVRDIGYRLVGWQEILP